VRGSSAIVQFARVVWALSCPDTANRATKLLEQIKNNLGCFPEPIGMTVSEQGIEFGMAPTVPHVETVSERAGDLLLNLLVSGQRKQTEIAAEVRGAGISEATANRVKARLGIVAVRKDNAWYWCLPTRNTVDA
jgi:hypothetical protein